MTALLKDLSVNNQKGSDPFWSSRPVLACGGQLKNTFALAGENKVFVSEPNGDLEDLESLTLFREGIEHFKQLLNITPQVIAYDLHPDYLSTKYARELVAQNPGLSGIGIQHHHAHIAACLADNKAGNDKVIGIAFDGTGFGPDGNIWGGEFLIADYSGFTRAAHLKYIPLPGGDKAVKEPWRMAASYLYRALGPQFKQKNLDFVLRLDKHKWQILERMLERNINCPLTSGMGRLFDAVSSLAGIKDNISYEGEAAIELEKAADKSIKKTNYKYNIEKKEEVYIIDPCPLIRAIVKDRQEDIPVSTIAAKFHLSIVDMVGEVCKIIGKENQLTEVALSGGVFQNRFLLDRLPQRLKQHGFKVYRHKKVPAGDSGISLGQLVIAGVSPVLNS